MRNNPRDQLLSLHRSHVEAWERMNLETLRSLYHDDAVIFNTVSPPRFPDFKTFENTVQQYFSRLREVTLFTSNIQIEVKGEVAWITSQYMAALRMDGEIQRQQGRWTEIYTRDDGDWKLAHWHSSYDPAENGN